MSWKTLEKSGLEPTAPNRLADRKHCALSTQPNPPYFLFFYIPLSFSGLVVQVCHRWEYNFAPKLLLLSGTWCSFIAFLLPFGSWAYSRRVRLGRSPASIQGSSKSSHWFEELTSSSGSPSNLCSELVWLSSRFFFDVIFSFPSSFPFSCVST